MPETKAIRVPIRIDDQGRLIPFTPAERAARAEALLQALEEIRNIPDDPNESSDEEVFRAIDSHRPHRPLFEDYY